MLRLALSKGATRVGVSRPYLKTKKRSNFWSGVFSSSRIPNNGQSKKLTNSEWGTEDVWRENTEENIWTEEGLSVRRLEKLHNEELHNLYNKNKQTRWSESASELYRPSDRRLSAKWLPTFADIGCHVVSVTDPYGPILGFLDRSLYFSIK
jgi:hypothetical protein